MKPTHDPENDSSLVFKSGRLNNRPRLLDLFCGAGGAAMGYHRAGFDVIGVDINPQPLYPFEFHQADAMTFPLDGYDVIHASPPCQSYSLLNLSPDTYPALIAAVRERLAATGHPYVIENVAGARRQLRAPVTLCATSFGHPLDGVEMHRHRDFESNVALFSLPCAHDRRRTVVGVYGRLASVSTRSSARPGQAPRMRASRAQARALMGMDWADDRGLTEAIPPDYTEHIGGQLMAVVV